MKWILIIYLIAANPKAVAVDSIEFNNELACEVAATAAEINGAAKAFCVTKGAE